MAAVGLLCLVLPAAGGAVAGQNMSGMSAMSEMSAPAASATGAVAGGAAPVAAVPALTALCEHACVTEVGRTCAVVGGLVALTLLGLLLATVRDTFLGSVPRVPRGPSRRDRSLRSRGPVPFALCVLRV